MYGAVIFSALYLPMVFNHWFYHNTLNVCAFTETFCPEAIERFQKETGVKINMTYVELDEQIYAKFKVDHGSGYDVINISDFMVQRLSSADFLQPLDHSKIPSISSLHQQLMSQEYDIRNHYSLPHKWFVYGILFDTEYFKNHQKPDSLDFLFLEPHDSNASEKKAPYRYKICILDSSLDSFFFAQLFLKNYNKVLSQKDYDTIEQLLVRQKNWVEAYTLYTVEYFLRSKLVPIALTSSNFARKIKENSTQFEFVVPKEGGILVVENLAVPKSSKKVDLAHKFINFMLSDEIARMNSQQFAWTSANRNTQEGEFTALLLDKQISKRLHIPLFPAHMRAKVEKVWLEVGFA